MSKATPAQEKFIRERQAIMKKARANKTRFLDREQNAVIDSLSKTVDLIGDVADLVKDAKVAVDKSKTSAIAQSNVKARPTAATAEAEAVRQDRQDARDAGFTGDLLKEQAARNTALRHQTGQEHPDKTMAKAIGDKFRQMGRGNKAVTISERVVSTDRPADMTIEWGPGRDDTARAQPAVDANRAARGLEAVEHLKEIEAEKVRKDKVVDQLQAEARESWQGPSKWLQRHRERVAVNDARIPEDRRRKETRPQ